jgi:hypothetical protein
VNGKGKSSSGSPKEHTGFGKWALGGKVTATYKVGAAKVAAACIKQME